MFFLENRVTTSGAAVVVVEVVVVVVVVVVLVVVEEEGIAFLDKFVPWDGLIAPVVVKQEQEKKERKGY